MHVCSWLCHLFITFMQSDNWVKYHSLFFSSLDFKQGPVNPVLLALQHCCFLYQKGYRVNAILLSRNMFTFLCGGRKCSFLVLTGYHLPYQTVHLYSRPTDFSYSQLIVSFVSQQAALKCWRFRVQTLMMMMIHIERIVKVSCNIIVLAFS